MLVVTLACMAIVVGIVGVMLQGALRVRRQLHAERNLRQTELLLSAGLDRAAHKLKATWDYDGETWKIPADELLTAGAGEVVIRVVAVDGEPWQVSIAAEYPLGTVASVRRSRTFVINR
jgi:hypothetical protein